MTFFYKKKRGEKFVCILQNKQAKILKFNDGNSKIYLICGIILAVVTGFGIYTSLDKTEQLVPIVVANQNIEPRTQITDKMLEIKKVPALGRSENTLEDPNMITGGYATSKIFAGQTIIQPMVSKQFDESGVSGLALSIPDENLRAISFPVSAADSVNGKIKKGDYVDIIATLNMGMDSEITKAILQGVEVFDVAGKNENISSISLLLSVDQAEIVKHAYNSGKISYALNPGNAKSARTTGIINKTLCERFNFTCVKK